MGPLDRFTRDELSAKVWWPFALVLIVLLVLTFPGQSRAISYTERRASDRAIALITGTLEANAGSVTGPISADKEQRLREELAPVLANDARIQAVRLWSKDGALLFSTDPSDRVGSSEALNDAILATASEASQRRIDETSRTDLLGDPSPAHFDTYLALPSDASVVAEVQTSEPLLLDGLRAWWLRLRLALGVASLLVLGLALLSMRRPLAAVGAGVPFYEATIPPGHALISLDEETQLRHAGAHAKERVQTMEGRLRELENEKLRLEGELQRALSTKASGIRVIPSPNVAAPPEPAPRIVRVEPTAAPEPAPAAKAEPAPNTVEPAPAPERVPPPAAEAPTPPAPRRVAASPTPAPSPVVRMPEAPVPVARRDVVVVPEAERDAFPRSSSSPDEEAVQVLNRLVEPVGARQEPEADPGAIRARLARTAALKKPGSRERREEREANEDR